ncbi:MAG: cysteine hydrolase [Dehalococcoidia bacterium]|nr:cysteine hydrolase [Dehalococcoidia bacterium]
MSYHNLDKKRTGILFFDMLNVYFRGADEASQRLMEPIVANCVRIMNAARKVNIPIFYAKADHRPDYIDCFTQVTDTDIHGTPWPDPAHPQRFMPPPTQGSWTGEVIEELKPQSGDYVIAKHRWSAFHQTHLELSLRTRGIDTIVLAGGSTEIGIASTVYSARDSDYNLVIVTDACISPNKDCHDIFMKRIFPRVARMRTTDQVIGMMG